MQQICQICKFNNASNTPPPPSTPAMYEIHILYIYTLYFLAGPKSKSFKKVASSGTNFKDTFNCPSLGTDGTSLQQCLLYACAHNNHAFYFYYFDEFADHTPNCLYHRCRPGTKVEVQACSWPSFTMVCNEAYVMEEYLPWTWWRHQMETFSALLAICAGNSPVTVEFPAQRPVTRSFDVFLDLRLNKRLSKQSWGW